MGVSCFAGTGIEKPREKLAEFGAGYLSDAELIALLLDTGTKGENVVQLAQRLLFEKGGLAGVFLSEGQQIETKGIKKAKSARMLAVKEILRRLPFTESFQVTTLENLVYSLRPFFLARKKETALILFLDHRKTVIKREIITSYQENCLLIPVGKIVRDAVTSAARFCLILHNHPSGDAKPSDADLATTASLYRQLASLNILLLDSLIMTDCETFSFRQTGTEPYGDPAVTL